MTLELAPFAKDIQLNLQSVLTTSSLDDEQRWSVALACVFAIGEPTLGHAILAEAATKVPDGALDDARAAATLMAMNNVLYRFRHQVGKESYGHMPARLRMNRMNQLRASKGTFELMCLAVSALAGCESCVRAHEKSVLTAGLREEHVFDAVRIASTLRAAATALTIQKGIE